MLDKAGETLGRSLTVVPIPEIVYEEFSQDDLQKAKDNLAICPPQKFDMTRQFHINGNRIRSKPCNNIWAFLNLKWGRRKEPRRITANCSGSLIFVKPTSALAISSHKPRATYITRSLQRFILSHIISLVSIHNVFINNSFKTEIELIKKSPNKLKTIDPYLVFS